MEMNWASDNLQTIRTLMERSALYRRTLAPVMILSGALGVAGAVVPCFVRLESDRAFSLFWLLIGLVALGVSLLMVRRQAIKDAETFWSLPTRRVAFALLPPFVAGLAAGVHVALQSETGAASTLAAAWVAAYGCALHSAGFFVQRGIKLFGWSCLAGGCAVLLLVPTLSMLQSTMAAHWLMGTFFGVLHLAYGAYLHFTEKYRSTT